MKPPLFLPKTVFLCAILITSLSSLAQTVMYGIPNTQLVNMIQTDPFGDWCFSNDWEQNTATGTIWGMDWNSTNLGSADSITIEMQYTNEEGLGPYDVTLNGVLQTTHNPPLLHCTYNVHTITFVPTSYNSGGLNQLRLDYTAGMETHYMQPNPAWGGPYYARITVKYGCTPSTSTDEHVACDSFTWTNGVTYTSSNTTATDTLVSATGCDSIVTLNLTIDTVNTSVTQMGSQLSSDETAAAYQWVACPSMTAISGDTSQVFNPSTNGDYAVIVTKNGCTDTSACITVSAVGVIENDFGPGLSLFPNPTKEFVTVDLGATYNDISVQLTDINGKLIRREAYPSNQRLTLQITEDAGVYFLRIRSGQKIAVLRILKK